MARVALVKLFTGLNLGVSQLSGELQRAGHDSLIVYFKDFLVVSMDEADRYIVSDYPGVLVGARGREMVWNCYKPFSDTEYRLLIEALQEFRVDLIGLSLSSLTIKPAIEVTARLKAAIGVPVVWGGAGPTLEPALCIPHADLVCVGEGEQVIVDLAQRIDAGATLTDVPGVWAKTPEGEVVRNPSRPLLELEDLAIPDFEPRRTLRINDDQIHRNIYPPNLGKQYIIMTTRGCPFSCSFCIESVYQDMFGKKNHLRRRSVDIVIRELVEARQRIDFNSVMFYDDVFTTHPRWLKEFARRYKAEVGLPFWCYTYPTTTKKDEIEMLRDAGCVSMTIGIQSGSEEVLNGYNRPVPREKAMEAARILVDSGIESYFDLITRVHFESEAHARQTFEFLCELPLGVRCIGFAHMTMFPGYGYTKKIADEGCTLSMTDKEYSYYHRLYLLARTPLPRFLVKAVSRVPLFRRYPSLIEPMLPKHVPHFFLGEDDGDCLAKEILNLPHAQAVIPGGQLDRGLPPEATLQ
jgi:anaerobic magnesium-protoporphyrin IX monomethyl ester cyclase